ncbi:MAG TPA: right-handed parallel beta-helix repeat-containing protein, partial [Terriglobales bacterium]|nr:right-handed parallel beta-helix repeat-containing protein [Terriglobales bacterium]
MKLTAAPLRSPSAAKGHIRFLAIAIALGAFLVLGQPAIAAVLCVNTGAAGGCFHSISAAVAAATAGDTILVAHGTYNEDVTINKSLYLIGENKENTVIDATGENDGITITGATNVAVSGFTVENANAAGIWITSSSMVTISNNIVKDNDKALIPGANASCPPLAGTPFEQGEAEDCGEGVFLSDVNHSTLASNIITENAGGILITDDTGPTHDNLITGNSVVKNTELDCGITLPSHSGAGVFHNTVSGNDSSYNGGPGVGIFAPGPGSKAYGNVVINNRLRGNGLPGVTMHNHAAPGVNGVPGFLPPPIFNDNVILGNDISANSQDFEDAATAGPTGINIYSVGPMTGTIVSQNVIHQEALDIVVKVPAAAIAAVQVHLNNLPGKIGLQNAGAATVDATQNWWGCSRGPGANGCSTISGSGVL